MRGNFRSLFLYRAVLPLLLIAAGVTVLQADYRRQQESDPFVRAIIWGEHTARAWIQIGDQPFHVVPGTTVNKTWYVSEIRRRSVLFSNRQTGIFLEAPLVTKEKPRFNRDTSFWSHELSLWDALELVSMAFKFNLVMHHQTGGSVKPQCHAETLERMLLKFMPPHTRFALSGPTLFVLPVQINRESWTEILNRARKNSHDPISQRFTGLLHSGTLLSRGDDIQFVLRQISLGSGVPIQFPSSMHFPVFAHFKDVPFYHILTKIAYINQCFLIDRTGGIEIQPLSTTRDSFPGPQFPELLTTGAWEPQPGTGPHPPPPVPWAPPVPHSWERLPPPAMHASDTRTVAPADSF